MGKRFREDKEMERKVLTSTDFTTVWGGAISIHQRNAIPRTRAPQLHHRRRLTSVSLPTAFPAFSKPRPRAFHSFATPPNPDGTGPRVKQCGAGSGAFLLL